MAVAPSSSSLGWAFLRGVLWVEGSLAILLLLFAGSGRFEMEEDYLMTVNEPLDTTIAPRMLLSDARLEMEDVRLVNFIKPKS